MSDNAAICPVCGTVATTARSEERPFSGYGQYPQGGAGDAPPYHQGYTPRPTPPPQGYTPPQQQNPIYGVPYQSPQTYPPGIHVTVVNNPNPIFGIPIQAQKNDSALVVEIILSLFGIFGAGWLIAGETTIGIILLICSVLLYWPFMILGTIFTLGLGLVCLGPIAIASIIINAVLLNNVLKRRAARVIIMQQPQQMPPMHP